MIAFLTSSPAESQDHTHLNPANGLVSELEKVLPRPARGLFVCSDPDDFAFTDRFAGETVDLPGGRCAQVRFRGSHREAPAQYRRLMDFLAGEGLRPAGFAREITMIDYGVTDDPSQFVTEITVPVEG